MCSTDGCDRQAVWTVVRPNTSSKHAHKLVCTKCRDELVAVYGWHLLYDHGRVPPAAPDDELDGSARNTRINLERVVRNIPDTDPLYHRSAAEGNL